MPKVIKRLGPITYSIFNKYYRRCFNLKNRFYSNGCHNNQQLFKLNSKTESSIQRSSNEYKHHHFTLIIVQLMVIRVIMNVFILHFKNILTFLKKMISIVHIKQFINQMVFKYQIFYIFLRMLEQEFSKVKSLLILPQLLILLIVMNWRTTLLLSLISKKNQVYQNYAMNMPLIYFVLKRLFLFPINRMWHLFTF